MKRLLATLLLLPFTVLARPNLLVITVDDMSCDSVGVYGCKVPGTTPHMDALATKSLRFKHAHVVVGNCMPSRNVMWSGRYPHNNGIEGFRSISRESKKYPVLGELLQQAGWFTAIRHKVEHSTPYAPFPWDLILEGGKGDGFKDPAGWGRAAAEAFTAAKTANEPFCALLNIADPHKPFYAEGRRGETVPDAHPPSKIFTPEEIVVPGFLPDDPVVRKELAHYYSSVRRADDAVGAILAALKATGEEENTIVLFLSDHGMPLPFAKTQLYHHSSRTPLMIRWPGVTKDGSVDDQHMISTVDLLPTLLEMLELLAPEGMDGSSFAAVLRGGQQPERTMVFKEHNENSGGQRTPMRAVQTRDHLYIFNPWSNGSRVMSGATAGTSTCRQMRVLAKTDAQVAERVKLFDQRVPEEAYDVSYDPDALTNLIDHPAHAAKVAELEQALEAWMVRTKDPLLEVFRKRDDAAVREAFMKQLEAKPRAAKGARKGKAKPQEALISLETPKVITAGQTVVVKLRHHLPPERGQMPVQVTLKAGDNSRIERKEVRVAGSGEVEVSFTIPAEVASAKVSFAGLVGTSIKDALHHVQGRPIPVRSKAMK